jgi:hypothetical protein
MTGTALLSLSKTAHKWQIGGFCASCWYRNLCSPPATLSNSGSPTLATPGHERLLKPSREMSATIRRR